MNGKIVVNDIFIHRNVCYSFIQSGKLIYNMINKV
jgi:hypothetical protein